MIELKKFNPNVLETKRKNGLAHDLFIYDSFNNSIVEKIVKQQKDMVKELRSNGKDPKNYSDRGVGILMDNLQNDKTVMTDPNVQEIFYNGRYFHITTILTLQFMMALPHEFRANVDYVFVFKETKKDNISRLYKYFFGMFENEKIFEELLLKYTDDYGCLVLDTRSRSNKIEDQVFYYRAVPDREFKIGAQNWENNTLLSTSINNFRVRINKLIFDFNN